MDVDVGIYLCALYVWVCARKEEGDDDDEENIFPISLYKRLSVSQTEDFCL